MATPVYHSTIVPPASSGNMSEAYFENFMNTTMQPTSGELIQILENGSRMVLIWKDY